LRSTGAAGASTARVYLPSSPRTLPIPVIVAAHPTDGKSPTRLHLRWTQHRTKISLCRGRASATLDHRPRLRRPRKRRRAWVTSTTTTKPIGARPARARSEISSAPGALSSQVAIIGYSQAAAPRLRASARLELRSGRRRRGRRGLRARVGDAMELVRLPIDAREPDRAHDSNGASASNVVEVMRTSAYFSNWIGSSPADRRVPERATHVVRRRESTRYPQIPLGGFLQANALHIGDFIDDASAPVAPRVHPPQRLGGSGLRRSRKGLLRLRDEGPSRPRRQRRARFCTCRPRRRRKRERGGGGGRWWKMWCLLRWESRGVYQVRG